MKLLYVLFFILLSSYTFAFDYISPKPNSEMNSPQTNIILRADRNVNVATLDGNMLEVYGSKSGKHLGKLELSDDNATITFQPYKPFALSEEVVVHYLGNITAADGAKLEPLTFSFKITEKLMNNPISDSEFGKNDIKVKDFSNNKMISGDTLPGDYPEITLKNVNNPAPGYFFFANPALIKNYGNFCMIVDNEGKTIAQRRTFVRGYDFKMQNNGFYSYADAVLPKGWFWANVVMYVLNENMAVVDSFQCGNGYQADMHEFKWLPNGHVFLLAQDPQGVDMSKYFKDGNPNATVAGTIIQELDVKKNVVFQWRSWDHLNFNETYEDTLAATVNPFHFNALDIDKDGNILVSVRHNCQILKISRKTGEIMWRLGGKTNQFQFIGEYPPINGAYFSHQHNIVSLPNGNISLYDNGWIRSPQFSRGVEYKLDEVNMTATKVWEYRHTPDIYTDLMGSVQLLSNGNRVICWGGPNPEGRELLTEVHPDNSIAIEMTFPPLFTSYRIYKHELQGCQTSAKVSINEVMQSNTYEFENDSVKTGITMTLNQLETFIYNNITVERFPCSSLYPIFDGKVPMIYNGRTEITTREIDSSLAEMHFNLTEFPEVIYPEKTIVFKRDTVGSGTFYPLVTMYDQSKNELVAMSKNFGEYILGWMEDPITEILSPIPVKPISGIKLNINNPIKLFWTNRGYYELNQIQISDNSEFSNIITDSALNGTLINLTTLPVEKQLYWRVRALAENQASAWSEIDSFSIVQPYIIMLNPVNNEIIKVNKSTTRYIAYWERNTTDPVRIELLRNGSFYKMIADSFRTNTNAYSWMVNDSIPEDSSYQIKVTTISSNPLSTISGQFRIVYDYTDVAEKTGEVSSIMIYPNPADNYINIQFEGYDEGNIELSVYDITGALIIQHDLGETGNGSIRTSVNTSLLNDGIYYLNIKTKTKSLSGTFVIQK